MARGHREADSRTPRERESALDLVRRSLLDAPVFTLVSLAVLVVAPIRNGHGFLTGLTVAVLVAIGVARVLFARTFAARYARSGESAIIQFIGLAALQYLALGVLAGMAVYTHWSIREAVLAAILSVGVIVASVGAMAVRARVRLAFMACLVGPLGYGTYLAAGAGEAAQIMGFLLLAAFLVWHGSRALTPHPSERRQVKAEIQKLGLALEQSQDSIVITNADGVIEYVNEAFLVNSGYSREEVLGQNPRIKRSAKTPPETYEDLWNTITRGDPWKGEFHSRRKDGSEYIELARIAPVKDEDGQITHFVALLEDITENKRIAEELKQHRHHLEELVEQRTEEMLREHAHAEAARSELKSAEAANQAKTAFLANMSHEIRTPMNAILGFTHLLLQDDMAPEQQDRLRKIDTAAQHLLSTINDILDLTKIEAGKMELEHKEFRVDDLIDHVLALTRQDIQRRGLTVRCEQNDVPEYLRGDETRLRQALLNYVSNAVKFTREGSITIRLSQLKTRGPKQLIQFEVEDTGIGVDPERLQYLFNAFEQGDSSTTRRHGGSGLGLAITRHIADLMGGNVGADSEPEKGSTFWFTAWLERSEGDGAAAQSQTEDRGASDIDPEHKGKCVLLVEDNRINREVAKAILRRAGLEVDTAENGLKAIEAVRARRYDMVLMDVQMPEMDGLDATRAIREMVGGDYAANVERLPILAMTAAIFEEDRRKCLQAGMDDFVAKPVNPRSLFAAMNEWFEEKM